jgi:hypothetical protein
MLKKEVLMVVRSLLKVKEIKLLEKSRVILPSSLRSANISITEELETTCMLP